MARWCLLTGQPAASWLTLSEVERQVFEQEAAEALRRYREGAVRG